MRVAAVDIGTNSTRLLVAEVGEGELFGRRLDWLDRRVTVTRLGQGVDAGGVLSDEAMGRTVAVLAGYGEAVRAWDVAAVRAVATSAARDAVNRDELLDRAGFALGVRPEVITGAEEAELSFLGALSGVEGDRPALVIDLGGGSTEFVMGNTELEYAVSVETGSVRLTERHLGAHPVTLSRLDAARAGAAEALADVTLPETPATVIGVAGTFTALAAIAKGLAAYDPTEVHGSTLTGDELTALVQRLAAMELADVVAIPSLDPARAPVVLGGAVVAEQALTVVEADRLVVSESDLLDGVALRAAGM